MNLFDDGRGAREGIDERKTENLGISKRVDWIYRKIVQMRDVYP